MQKLELEEELVSETEINKEKREQIEDRKQMQEQESDGDYSLPDARFILYMCEDLIDKKQQRDEKLSEKNQEISFL